MEVLWEEERREKEREMWEEREREMEEQRKAIKENYLLQLRLREEQRERVKDEERLMRIQVCFIILLLVQLDIFISVGND